MKSWPEHPSKGVAPFENDARGFVTERWTLISHKSGFVLSFFLSFRLTGLLHVHSGKS